MKGQKTGGRLPGSANKITTVLRQQINDFLNDNWEQAQADYKTLEPKDRLAFYDKMLAYGLPKPAPEQAEQPKNDNMSIFDKVTLLLQAAELRRIQ